jgi:protein-glutamine gamma-glutamyltransferase
MGLAASPHTSMENERPQLSVLELHQLRWFLGGLVAITSLAAVWYLDLDASIGIWGAMASCIVTLLRPAAVAKIPQVVHKLAFPVALSVFAFDLYTFGQFLPALVRLAVVLLWYRSCTYRKRRDDLQLVLLGLFLIVTAGVLTVSIGFAVQIVLFVGLSLGLLFIRTLVDSIDPAGEAERAETGERPPWIAGFDWAALYRRTVAVIDWRVCAFCSVLFVGLVVFSGVVFLVIPRFQIESSIFLDRLMNQRSVSGFTDTLRFGEVSDIQKDESVVIRVDVTDPKEVPAQPYWRMAVLDEYRDRAFRVSQDLKQNLFRTETTRSTIDRVGLPSRMGAASWTFYVEPGVSRYLPLLGSAMKIQFTEPQTFRVSDRLRLILLSRDPATMKAYRVERMSTGPILEGLLSPSSSSPLLLPSYSELPFAPEEIEQLSAAVREITGGEKLSATDFSAKATAWIQQRHAYALSNVLPSGEGDPLLRWLFSKEPGHCELFAGSFTVLARAAGFPARVVAGFLGGTWNEDYLNIRNSNAHAWCEIYLGDGRWMRVDPTASTTDTALAQVRREQANGPQMRRDTGWSAKMDRLKMFWYRRVVRFEQEDQLNLARALKAQTENSTRGLKEWFSTAKDQLKTWLSRPWDFARGARVLAALVLAVVLTLLFRQLRTRWIWKWRARRGGKKDPVRAEAGLWLRRLDSVQAVTVPELDRVRSELLRLRYGHPVSWPDPRAVFTAAKRAYRAAKRGKVSV